MVFGIETGFGYWNPIVWVALFILMFIGGYLIAKYAEGRAMPYRGDEYESDVFLSGFGEKEQKELSYPSKHLYWGFRKALEGAWYRAAVEEHSGILTTYVFWIVILLLILLIIVILGGAA
ncbi:MAG: hypothetical protein PWR13_91 [Archaeoglobi archaeon]|nr:hydrogenase [Candidatus Mnemosynella bozhongmuii]MDI3501902.1 hypothetical protein [Archaeoglobi archaeon]MDK2781063.1 hypothetical protein [Archaeoglobi archaeon]